MRQTLCDGYLVIFALAQAVILLVLTPLFTGISRQIRARMHSRRGPGIWQDYRDIHKLFKRQEVAPTSSGLMFRLMPWVLISSMLVLAMALPLFIPTDRKSTRLNSSHVSISYAVFCLKTKRQEQH